ncbi:hypothetical protein F4808DRAFT_446504 [Astrocystis sublimbata]|nr:hypothetical protein F4808DRAFT_446504 [Astrocystis sublimbata]
MQARLKLRRTWNNLLLIICTNFLGDTSPRLGKDSVLHVSCEWHIVPCYAQPPKPPNLSLVKRYFRGYRIVDHKIIWNLTSGYT